MINLISDCSNENIRKACQYLGLFVLAMALLAGCRRSPSTGEKKNSQGYEVHGYVLVKGPVTAPAVKGARESQAQILLPDFEVFLKNASTGVESKPVKSNLFGMFIFPPQPPATYEMMWHQQGGWEAGSLPGKVVIRDHVQYPGPIEPKPRKDYAVVTGRVKLADGSSPWFQDEFFAVFRTATIVALDSSEKTVADSVRSNYQGEFAIAGLPAKAATNLSVTSEGAKTTFPLEVGAFNDSRSATQAEITLNNRRPRLSGAVATLNGQAATLPPPGSVLRVIADAKDPDGDPLSFVWKTQAGTVAGKGPEVDWTLPRGTGIFELDVLVSDGKGGDVTGKVVVGAGATGFVFSGRVVNQAGNPVESAAVWVGDQKPVTTNKSGVFRLEAKEAKEYVLNIKAAGYALRSKFSERPLPYQTYRLVPAQVQQVNADANMELVDRRPELESKKLKGSTIRVPAGALVDGTGKKVSGQVTAEIATLDIANDEMPGIMRTVKEGKTSGLISYGAVHVEFTDAAGNVCQLAPGAEAEAAIPLPSSMLAQAPPTMPLWSYDAADGQWKPSGSAMFDKAEGLYRGKVSHLSTINTDQEFANPATIHVRTDISLPAELTLSASDPNVPGDPGPYTAYVGSGVLEGELTQDVGGSNLVRLCYPGRHIKFDFKDHNGVSVNQWIIVESGDTYKTVGTPLSGNQVVAGAANTTIDVTIKLNPLFRGYPPNSPFLTFKNTGSATLAASYYDDIDPLHDRTTLADWYTQNGFDAITGEPNPPPSDPNDYARTSYLNDNDLGSGRDMHFLRHAADGTISAYVTNYSRGVNFDQRFAFAGDALAKSQGVATVCMEYKPVGASGPPIVKFFVYADFDGLPGVERQLAADLDGFGANNKFVPNLCMNCHGAINSYSPASGGNAAVVDLGANFRELDVATYRFPIARDLASQQDDFRKQNLMIANAPTPVGANPIARGPIRDLINGWYPGGAGNQDNAYTPPGWVGAPQHDLYHNVVKVSCRTCHIAFDSNDDSGGKDWNRYDQMVRRRHEFYDMIHDFAIGSNRVMPHALVTYRNFWLKQIGQDFGTYVDSSVDTDASYPHPPGQLRWSPPLGPP